MQTDTSNDWMTVIKNSWANISTNIAELQIFVLSPKGNDAICILWKYNNILGAGLILSYGMSKPWYFRNIEGTWQSYEL